MNTVDSLMNSGLNNNDWGVLLLVVNEGKISVDSICNILSIQNHEVERSLITLQNANAVVIDGDVVIADIQ